MKQPHIFFKIGAVLSALLLSGGLVAYRGGVFNRYLGDQLPTNSPPPLSGSKSKALIEPATPGEQDGKPLASSENEDAKPPAVAQQPPAENQAASQQAPATPPPQEKQPNLGLNLGIPQPGAQYMGGLKFGGVFIPPTFNPPPEKAPDASRPAPRSP